MHFCRWLWVMLICLLLQACVSPRMSQELELGKARFAQGDYKRAFRQLLPIAVKGNPQAQYAVGYMYYYGYGPSRDEESGIFWMNKAAEKGCKPAITALYLIYHKKPQCITTEPQPTSEETYVERSYKDEALKRQVQANDEVLQAVVQNRLERPEAIPVTPVKDVRENITSSDKESLKTNLEEKKQMTAVTYTSDTQKTPEESRPSLQEPFTLQLFGAFTLEKVKNLQHDLDLQKNTKVWRSENQGKEWYVLTYGKFTSSLEAKQAREKLSDDVKDLDPWIRKLNGLKEIG